ncbi:hypothetical protein AGOR_G00172320 [Albula goreensis]|uniref:Ig-like domain-containing protein n=1 Tax=Albula goreensis TaxID=1534307 RepID=A0A8T3CZ45_9TELE|nr:hypothetical protein AGOR_G00172320 [Albula goreensis]
MVRTDTPQRKGHVSIIDDPAQQVFTVTMRNLQEGDSDTYWCGVEINRAADDGFKLYLTVTEGPAALSVLNNMVSGEEGGSVSIQCRYGDSLRTSVKRWCSFLERSPCLTPGGTGMSQHASVQISDNRRGVFTVTVRRLERKDTGWYFCSAGEEHIPVHINVTQRVTQRAVTTRAVTQRVTTTAALQKIEGSSSTAHQTAAASDLSTENGLIPSTAQNLTHRAPSSLSKQRPLLVILLPLLTLLLVVLVTVFIVTRKVCNKQKHSQPCNTDTAETSTNLTPSADPGDSVIYSSIVIQDRKTVQLSADSGDSVIYSAVFTGNR